MSGRGSTGNVIAAVCSFFVPGLGQLVQGRIFATLDASGLTLRFNAPVFGVLKYARVP